MEECLFMSRLVVYCLLWILSWFIFVPLSIVLDKYKGYCLFYADRADFGPVAVCGYIITVPILASVLYAGYMAVSFFCKISIYNSLGFIQQTMGEFLVTVVLDGLAFIFMFVSASLVSAGFNDMCWNIFGTIDKCSQGYLKHVVFGIDDKFYNNIKMAEVAGWLSWLLWLAQFLIGLTALFRSGVLPQGQASPDTLCCGALPCRPHCMCTCKLQFSKPEPPDAAASPVKQAAIKTVRGTEGKGDTV
ncbi:transmembrane protein 179-like [Littorina saxatilis]|uniref:Transmembrane protein n=1 Tax=Littorina saxatilis TaxID=31220 RepID=A0AAN9BCW6_9CAEN